MLDKAGNDTISESDKIHVHVHGICKDCQEGKTHSRELKIPSSQIQSQR